MLCSQSKPEISKSWLGFRGGYRRGNYCDCEDLIESGVVGGGDEVSGVQVIKIERQFTIVKCATRFQESFTFRGATQQS